MSLPGAILSRWGVKPPGGWAFLAVLTLAMLLASASTAAATTQTSSTEIEGEVMCPICGTLLELAESPQAQRERVLVKRLVAEGRTKSEVKDILVAQYGQAVLALPSGSGFDLSAYLVPAIGFVLAAVGLALGVRRWRRAAKKPPGSEGPAAANGPRGEDAERLEADLARYDL